MTCSMAACYRERLVEGKSYVVDFKGGRNSGDRHVVTYDLVKVEDLIKAVKNAKGMGTYDATVKKK